MPLEKITLALFGVCNSIRVVAYIPQIFRAASDKNGASSISLLTWFLFLLAHLSTVCYALINRSVSLSTPYADSKRIADTIQRFPDNVLMTF